MTGHIKTLMQDETLYNELYLQGGKDVEDNYSIGVICNRLIGVYEDILSRKQQSN